MNTLLATALLSFAHAQDIGQSAVQTAQDTSQQSSREERMEVTGSHIKRVDMEGPAPVQILDQKYLENTGYNSVADVLRNLSVNSFGSSRERSGRAGAGVATVSLRGLGSNRTLVLLNGKRLANDGIASSPDLNLISMGAVKRMDVLKDSSSAIYGSDAVGGVVNIITKKDFTGAELNVRQEVAELEGGDKRTLSGTFGLAGSRYNGILSLQYRKNDIVFSRDRSWFREGVSPATPSPNILAGANRGPLNGQSYNPQEQASRLPNLEQFNVLGLARYDLDSATELSLQLTGSRKKVDYVYAPGAIAFMQRGPEDFRIQATPYIDSLNLPGHTPGTPLSLYWRSVPFGNRLTESTAWARGLNLGFKRYLGEDWELQASVGTERIERDEQSFQGYSKMAQLKTAIEDGTCDIFREGGRCDVLDRIAYRPWLRTTSRTDLVDVRAFGELFKLPSGGPVSMAVGTQGFYESFANEVDALSEAKGVAGGGVIIAGQGDREVYALYSEVSAILPGDLEVQLAGRYDRYSDFGNTFNPKAALSWRPAGNFLLRASASTGFKAPDLNDLYSSESAGYPWFVDELACQRAKDEGEQNPAVCSPKQYRVVSGGSNKNLREETSRTFNLGVVYEPFKSFSVGLDAFDINAKNLVGSAGLDTIMEAERDGKDLSRYNVVIERDADGTFRQMTAKQANLAQARISGVDFSLNYTASLAGVGELRLASTSSYLVRHEIQDIPGEEFKSRLGDKGYPVWRNNIQFEYAPKDELTFVSVLTTTGSQSKMFRKNGRLKRYTNVDAHVAYTTPKRFGAGTVTLGAANVLGSTVPLDESNINAQVDESLYDGIGRRFFVAYRHAF